MTTVTGEPITGTSDSRYATIDLPQFSQTQIMYSPVPADDIREQASRKGTLAYGGLWEEIRIVDGNIQYRPVGGGENSWRAVPCLSAESVVEFVRSAQALREGEVRPTIDTNEQAFIRQLFERARSGCPPLVS